MVTHAPHATENLQSAKALMKNFPLSFPRFSNSGSIYHGDVSHQPPTQNYSVVSVLRDNVGATHTNTDTRSSTAEDNITRSDITDEYVSGREEKTVDMIHVLI